MRQQFRRDRRPFDRQEEYIELFKEFKAKYDDVLGVPQRAVCPALVRSELTRPAIYPHFQLAD